MKNKQLVRNKSTFFLGLCTIFMMSITGCSNNESNSVNEYNDFSEMDYQNETDFVNNNTSQSSETTEMTVSDYIASGETVWFEILRGDGNVSKNSYIAAIYVINPDGTYISTANIRERRHYYKLGGVSLPYLGYLGDQKVNSDEEIIQYVKSYFTYYDANSFNITMNTNGSEIVDWIDEEVAAQIQDYVLNVQHLYKLGFISDDSGNNIRYEYIVFQSVLPQISHWYEHHYVDTLVDEITREGDGDDEQITLGAYRTFNFTLDFAPRLTGVVFDNVINDIPIYDDVYMGFVDMETNNIFVTRSKNGIKLKMDDDLYKEGIPVDAGLDILPSENVLTNVDAHFRDDK